MGLTVGQEVGASKGTEGGCYRQCGCGGEGLCVETAHSRRETDGARGQVVSVTRRLCKVTAQSWVWEAMEG